MNTARYLSSTRGRPNGVASRARADVRVGAGEETGGKDTMTPIDACGFGPGGEIYKDPKGHEWWMVCVPPGVTAVSPADQANAAVQGRDRAEVVEKIDALSTSRGYFTLAVIVVGIGGALWWFFREVRP